MNIRHRNCQGGFSFLIVAALVVIFLGVTLPTVRYYLKKSFEKELERSTEQLLPPGHNVNIAGTIPKPVIHEQNLDWDWVLAKGTRPTALYIYHLTNVAVTSFRGEPIGNQGPVKYWYVTINWSRNDGSRIAQEFKLQTPSSVTPTFIGVNWQAMDQLKKQLQSNHTTRVKL